MRRIINFKPVFGLLSLFVWMLVSYAAPAEPADYGFKYGEDARPVNKDFSIKFWGGSFKPVVSKVNTADSINVIKGKERDCEDNCWAGGMNISDIALFPSARRGILSQLYGGIDIFKWHGGFTVLANDGTNEQLSELEFNTIAAIGHFKLTLLSGGLRPYLGVGAGPAWTQLLDKRTTTPLALLTPNLEKDRAWDTSNLAEAFGGFDIYLGDHFHFVLEIRWIGLSNMHLVFPDDITEHHTAKVRTSIQGWLSIFGIGIKF